MNRTTAILAQEESTIRLRFPDTPESYERLRGLYFPGEGLGWTYDCIEGGEALWRGSTESLNRMLELIEAEFDGSVSVLA